MESIEPARVDTSNTEDNLPLYFAGYAALYNFTSFTADPRISMNINVNTEAALDGAWMESSIDNGLSWQIVGGRRINTPFLPFVGARLCVAMHAFEIAKWRKFKPKEIERLVFKIVQKCTFHPMLPVEVVAI